MKFAPPTCPTCGGRVAIWTRRRRPKPRVRQSAAGRHGWMPEPRDRSSLGSVRVRYWYRCTDPWHHRAKHGFAKDAQEAVEKQRRRARREVAGARGKATPDELAERRRERTLEHRTHQDKERR